MKRMSKKLSVLLMASVAYVGSFSITPAAAAGCSCGAIRGMHAGTRAVIRDEGQQIRQQIRESIEKQTADLIEYFTNVFLKLLVENMKVQERQNSNYQQAQIEAATRIEDAAQINNTNRLKDEFRAKAESGEYDPNPFACMLLDLFGTGGGSAAPGNATGTAVVARADQFLSGNDPIVQQGGAALSKRVVDDNQRLRGFGGSADATTDVGLLLKEPTIQLDNPQMQEVASIIVRNMIDAAPEDPVTEEELLTPAGLDRAVDQINRKARRDAALESIEMAINMRANVNQNSRSVEEFKKMARQSAYNREFESLDSMSELQQLDIMTVNHYAPTGERAETLSTTGKMNEKAWLYEIHRSISILTRINYLQLELANRDAVVNAAILATLTDPE